jgi:predicted phage terminase large subunit-like protein
MTQKAAAARRCEQSLMHFVRRFWHVVEPGRTLKEGRVLEEMCAHLEAVTRFTETNGEEGCQNLLMNVPPGSMKSLLVDVFWPAWEWGPRNMPHLRYVCASYSEDLTLRDNVRFTLVIKSQLYQEWWGERVQITKDTEGKVGNTKMGWKLATSVGGVGTGERGDRFIVDDPHNVKDGESEAKRSTTLHWWREVVPTRLNDPDLSSKIVIMQRVHEDDVSGDIISRQLDYVHLMLPMEFDPDRSCETDFGGDWRTEPGELLWPERFSEQAVANLKHEMGPYAFASQMQQSPTPRGGGIIKSEWWGLYDETYAQRLGIYDPKVDEKLRWPDMEFVIASLDTAFKKKQENDYHAISVLGIWHDEYGLPKVMLLDSWKKRLTLHGEMPEKFNDESDLEYLRRTRKHWGLVENVVYTCRRHKVDRLLIEDSAKASSLEEELVRLFNGEKFAVELVQATLDKVARLHSVQHLFTQNIVYAPAQQWAENLINNTSNFPKVTHDDDVDSLSQGLRWLRDTGWALRRDERDRELEREAMLENQPAKRPLYDI